MQRSPWLKKLRCFGLLVLSCLYITAWAQSPEEWQPTFITVEDGFRGPTEPLAIQLPSTVGNETLQFLALELDGIDVSQIVQLEQTSKGFVVKINSPQPLAVGQHSLRMVQYSPAGDILERGAWSFEVRQSRNFREASFAANSTLDVSRRVSDHDLTDLPPKWGGTGSSQIEGRIAGENWEANALLSLLYDSQGVQTEGVSVDESGDPRGGRDLDLGEFLVNAKTETLSAMVGHHAIDHQSLIMQDFYRRGVSFTASNTKQSLSVTGFATRTEPITGFRDGLGVGKADRRVAGGLVSLKPITGKPNALIVTGSYLEGEGQDQSGIGVGGEDAITEGDGWSLAAESHLADEKFKLRGEYAKTRFDFDGDGAAFDEEPDDAVSVLAVYSPWQDKTINDKPALLEFGAEYQQIGLFFHSLANPTLPSDRELVRGFGNFQWNGLALQLSVGAETDNVEDSPLLPTLKSKLDTLVASYTPEQKTDDQGNLQLAWYGQPSYSLGYQLNTQTHTDVPNDFAGNNINQRVDQTQLAANFQYQTWGWLIGYSFGWTKDLTDVSSDQRNRLVDLGANVQAGERLSIGLQTQYSTIFDRDNNITTRSRLANINADAIFIPEKLFGGLNISLNRDNTTDDSQNVTTGTAGFNLNWQLRQANNNRPGLTFWLRGELQDINDKVNNDADTSPYQVFLGVTIGWPVAYPQAQ